MTTTVRCSISCAITMLTHAPMPSPPSRRLPRHFGGTSMATLWGDRSGSPSSSMVRIGCSSCPTTKVSTCDSRPRRFTRHSPAAFRSGDFSQALPAFVVTDPLTGLPFPNNVIPTARLDPIAIKLLQYYPAPNIPGAGLSNNYLALDNVTEDKYQITERVDFAQSAKSSWFSPLQPAA